MTVGGSLLLIAGGAILRFAVTAHVAGVSLSNIGTILMVLGVVGLVISLIWLGSTRHRPVSAVQERTYSAPTAGSPWPYEQRVKSAGSTTTRRSDPRRHPLN